MLARDHDSWRDLSGSLHVCPRRVTSDDNDNNHDHDHDHDDNDNDALIFHSTSTHQLGI